MLKSKRISDPKVFCKKDILKHFVTFTGKPPACNFIKRETLVEHPLYRIPPVADPDLKHFAF